MKTLQLDAMAREVLEEALLSWLQMQDSFLADSEGYDVDTVREQRTTTLQLLRQLGTKI